jgi:hypothetical protein
LEVAKKRSEGVFGQFWAYGHYFWVSFPFLAVSSCFGLEELLNNLPKSYPNQKERIPNVELSVFLAVEQ